MIQTFDSLEALFPTAAKGDQRDRCLWMLAIHRDGFAAHGKFSGPARGLGTASPASVPLALRSVYFRSVQIPS